MAELAGHTMNCSESQQDQMKLKRGNICRLGKTASPPVTSTSHTSLCTVLSCKKAQTEKLPQNRVLFTLAIPLTVILIKRQQGLF